MELVIDRGVKSYDVKDADGTLLGVIKINPAADADFDSLLALRLGTQCHRRTGGAGQAGHDTRKDSRNGYDHQG